MVTRYTTLFILLLSTSLSHAMEREEEATYTKYMIVMKNGLAEDYQALASEFSEKDAPSLQALAHYPSYKLDRGEEIFAPFVLIRELLQRERGHEKRIKLPTSSASNTLLGITLTFESAVPITAFPDKQFERPDEGQTRLPTIIAGKTAITAYRLSLAQQHGEEFQPGTNPPFSCPEHLKPLPPTP
ncbi:hypothetical protein E3J61_00505 [Candidatus Dependentiae bacterium]|nr:MAG: hypothetical protein E3J61_00505 [Candidatus Dependentiae bacterium]